MTIKQARKILGKLGKNLSDKQIEKEIENVNFLAEIYLKDYPKFTGKVK